MLKKIAAVLYIFIYAFIGAAKGQGFSIDNVNTGAFPDITLKISQPGNKTIAKSGITVSENNQKVDVTQVPIENTSPTPSPNDKKAICFLVENSGFETSAQVSIIKSAIKSVLSRAENNYVANICYYNETRQAGAVNHVSTEFTNDYASLIKDMNNRVGWRKNEHPEVDLYKAIYECIEFISNKTSLPDNKQIILISTGNNNGTSPIKLSDCIDKLKNTGIVVNGIGIRSADNNANDNIRLACNGLGGKYEMDNNATDIAMASDKYIKNTTENGKNSDLSGAFYLKYTSKLKADGSTVNVKVAINGTEKTTTYKVKQGSKDNLSTAAIGGICAVAVIIIAGIILFVITSNNKKKRQLEEDDRKAAELVKARARDAAEKNPKANSTDPASVSRNDAPTQVNPIINDPRKTVVAGIKTAKLRNPDHSVYNLNEMNISIGRNPGNTIVIPDISVSGNHAMITNENGKWFITDRNSTNGVYINGQKTTRAQLLSGMDITFGKVNCIFEIS